MSFSEATGVRNLVSGDTSVARFGDTGIEFEYLKLGTLCFVSEYSVEGLTAFVKNGLFLELSQPSERPVVSSVINVGEDLFAVRKKSCERTSFFGV